MRLAELKEQEIVASHSNLQQELSELRTRELETVRLKAGQLLAEARATAERELEVARRQAVRISEVQRDSLSQVAAAVAAKSVGELLEQIAGRELHSALIDAACQQLRSLPAGAIAPVKIETAQPLSAEQRAALESVLGPAAVSADFRTVENLVGGIRVTTAKGLIDASVSGLASFARQTLVKELNQRAHNPNPMQSAIDA